MEELAAGTLRGYSWSVIELEPQQRLVRTRPYVYSDKWPRESFLCWTPYIYGVVYGGMSYIGCSAVPLTLHQGTIMQFPWPHLHDNGRTCLGLGPVTDDHMSYYFTTSYLYFIGNNLPFPGQQSTFAFARDHSSCLNPYFAWWESLSLEEVLALPYQPMSPMSSSLSDWVANEIGITLDA